MTLLYLTRLCLFSLCLASGAIWADGSDASAQSEGHPAAPQASEPAQTGTTSPPTREEPDPVHPDFTGHWLLDEGLSDTMDALMTLQGVPWAMRKMAEGLDHEVHQRQQGDRLILVFDNALGDFRQELIFDGVRHETLNPAGRTTYFATQWSKDGQSLISSGPVDLDGEEGVLTERRSLDPSGQILTLMVALKTPDGKESAAKRIYRKQ